jgi:DNA-binding NtrC family response regulator
MFAPENKWILLVEPDEITLGMVDAILTELGYPVTPCRTAADAMSLASSREFDLAIVGMDLPGPPPMELVNGLRRRRSGLPVVLLSKIDSIRLAVEHLRQGVDDYLLLPPDISEVRLRVGRILEARELDSTMVLLRREIVRKAATHELVDQSPAMRAVVEKARKIAPMKSTVLILGESGVGKELVARSIHYASPRRDQPFVALNCSAIPESLIESELFGHERGAFTGAVSRAQGKFEIAHRGTLFLDEIGEMTPSAQV